MHLLLFLCSFPDRKKTPELYNKWLENVNKHTLVKFVPTEATRICSEHFSYDMKEEGGQRVTLKPFAVPTIFYACQVCPFVSVSHILCNSWLFHIYQFKNI